MDAGVPVLAAAAGTITQVQDGNFDRQTAFGQGQPNDTPQDNRDLEQHRDGPAHAQGRPQGEAPHRQDAQQEQDSLHGRLKNSCHVILENTSATLTERADQAGNRLPARAVTPPISGPHHRASRGILKAGKKATGNLTPPRPWLMTR